MNDDDVTDDDQRMYLGTFHGGPREGPVIRPGMVLPQELPCEDKSGVYCWSDGRYQWEERFSRDTDSWSLGRTGILYGLFVIEFVPVVVVVSSLEAAIYGGYHWPTVIGVALHAGHFVARFLLPLLLSGIIAAALLPAFVNVIRRRQPRWPQTAAAAAGLAAVFSAAAILHMAGAPLGIPVRGDPWALLTYPTTFVAAATLYGQDGARVMRWYSDYVLSVRIARAEKEFWKTWSNRNAPSGFDRPAM